MANNVIFECFLWNFAKLCRNLLRDINSPTNCAGFQESSRLEFRLSDTNVCSREILKIFTSLIIVKSLFTDWSISSSKYQTWDNSTNFCWTKSRRRHLYFGFDSHTFLWKLNMCFLEVYTLHLINFQDQAFCFQNYPKSWLKIITKKDRI